MPTITVSINTKAEVKSLITETAIVILGKNRNFIKNEMSKNINIFKTRIFTDNPFVSEAALKGLKRVLIIAGDDRAGAIETAVFCRAANIKAVILTEKPIYRTENYAEAVLTVQNAELAECAAALANLSDLQGAYGYICGMGESVTAAAADAFSKLPADVTHMKIFTDAPVSITENLFSLVCQDFEVFSSENDGGGYTFNLFVK
jgi:hypothetical protein